jgi:hypothetical protein
MWNEWEFVGWKDSICVYFKGIRCPIGCTPMPTIVPSTWIQVPQARPLIAGTDPAVKEAFNKNSGDDAEP